ncbi:MAG TPA: hypothetical protein VMS92_22875 [Mycobacterium sp.]|nr:hypothetical protein [Mycobacterium sp.]
MNLHKLLFIVGTALTGIGTTVPSTPGVIMTVIGGLLLTLSKPEAVSKVTAKLSPKSDTDMPEATP